MSSEQQLYCWLAPTLTGARAARGTVGWSNVCAAAPAGVEPQEGRLSAKESEGQDFGDRLRSIEIGENLNDPIFSKALDGTIQSWNTGAEHLYGYRADEVVGKPVSILAPPERFG